MMADTPRPYNALTIIGGGLIGCSVARAARRQWPDLRIIICDSNKDNFAKILDLGVADSVEEVSGSSVTEADLVILAVPVGAMASVIESIAPHLKAGATLSDVGSVKAEVLATMQALCGPDVHIIPGHPVAGTEESGPGASIVSLFEGRWSILTPPVHTDEGVLQALSDFWQGLGSRVEIMDAKHHDLVLAITSHVPHLIAYNIVGTASDLEQVTQSEVIKYSAGGFRDFTRIAASNPTMWRDVFLNNKEAVLEMLGRFNEDLSALARAIRWGDGDALYALFDRTRTIRRDIVDAGQDDQGPDFGRQHESD